MWQWCCTWNWRYSSWRSLLWEWIRWWGDSVCMCIAHLIEPRIKLDENAHCLLKLLTAWPCITTWLQTLIPKPCQSCQCLCPLLYNSTLLLSWFYDFILFSIQFSEFLLFSINIIITYKPIHILIFISDFALTLLFPVLPSYICDWAHVWFPLEWLLFVLILSQSEILSWVLLKSWAFLTLSTFPLFCFPSWIVLTSLFIVLIPSWGHQQTISSIFWRNNDGCTGCQACTTCLS